MFEIFKKGLLLTCKCTFLSAVILSGLISFGFVTWQQDTTIGGLPYKVGTEEAARVSVESGRPVVAYFTADWCVYCKVFKDTVLSDAEVVKALSSVDRYLVDLTNRDDPRWALLRKLGGSGIPFVVIYKDGRLTALVAPLKSEILRALNG